MFKELLRLPITVSTRVKLSPWPTRSCMHFPPAISLALFPTSAYATLLPLPMFQLY